MAGILLVAVSFYVVFTPMESYVNLAGIFSVLVLITGLLATYFSITNRKILSNWGWYLAGGIFETIAGIGLLYYPEISVAMLPVFIGFWLLFKSAQLVGNSIELKQYGILDWGWFLLLGVLLSLLSMFMILDPIFGSISIISLTFISLFTAGISNIWFSINLKKVKAGTIDKVEDLKKEFKNNFNDLKKEVLDTLANATEEESKEEKQSNQYESSPS